MKSFLILLVLGLASAKLEQAEELDLETSQTFLKFMEMVEQHKLNVSILISAQEIKKDAVEKAALVSTLPVNNIQMTQSGLSKEVTQQLLNTASSEGLSAISRRIVGGSGKVESSANGDNGLTSSDIWDVIAKAEAMPLIPQDKSFAAMVTFLDPQTSGTKTRVIVGELDVKVVQNQGLSEEEVSKVKEAVKTAKFTYTEDLWSAGIQTILNQKLPNLDWQVSIGLSEESHLGSTKYLVLQTLNTNIAVWPLAS